MSDQTFTAHLFGRSRRGDREEVLIKLFDFDGEGGESSLIRAAVQTIDGVIPDRPIAPIVFWFCWDNPVESMNQYDPVILIPAPEA